MTDGAEVHSVNDLLAYKDEIDVLIICGGSASRSSGTDTGVCEVFQRY